MQVVVSISFATTGADRTPVAGEALAEILLISMLLGMCQFSSEKEHGVQPLGQWRLFRNLSSLS
jgi:hypothetical protein